MNANIREYPGMRQSFDDPTSPARLAMAPACRKETARTLIGEAVTADDSEEISHYRRASEDDLVRTAQSGDEQAFVELCRRHSASVRRRILSIVRNQEDAEDALQDTLLRAYVHMGTFRRTCKFSSWITSIGVNTALMILRKRKVRNEVQPELINAEGQAWEGAEYMDHSLDPESTHFKRQIIFLARREVGRLRPSLRAAIEQFYGSECTLAESAKALDISVASAKSRLMRGRSRLRWSLRRRGILSSGV
jgi:RNA polymerase sigma-70 factor, ECF subfamily